MEKVKFTEEFVMCMENHVFCKKNVYKWAKHEKAVDDMETYRLLSKEKVPGAAVSKKIPTDILL